MMNFKKAALGAAFAASVTAAGLGMSDSAQAADIAGKTLSFSGTAKLEKLADANWRLNFANFANTSTGTALNGDTSQIGTPSDLGNMVFSTFTIKDLLLTANDTTPSPNSWALTSAPVTSWLSGGALGTVSYDLNTFNLIRSGTDYLATLTGIFRPQDVESEVASASFTSQLLISGTGNTYSASITAVPVPALLPGAIGVGVAAFRRRKSLKAVKA
jgi:hypothetical protein